MYAQTLYTANEDLKRMRFSPNESLPLECPCCSRKLRGAPFMLHATQSLTRTCRCGKSWQIKVEPMEGKRTGIAMHHVSYFDRKDSDHE